MNEFDKLPKEMTQTAYFCLWNRENKQPYAHTNDKDTFSKIEDLLNKVNDKQGLGFGLFEHFCGFDIDKCINDKGEISKEALEVINTLKSYCELSPSKKGYHIFFKLENAPKDYKEQYLYKNSNLGFEMYSECINTYRYFTLTGNKQGNYEFRSIDFNEIKPLLDKYMKKPTKTYEFNEYTQEISNNMQYLEIGLKNDDKLFNLWHSTPTGHGGNESETDLALLSKLAYWLNGNKEDILKAFYQSPYYAKKDDEHKAKAHREDYILGTLDKALSMLTSTAKQENDEYLHKQSTQINRDYREIEEVKEEIMQLSNTYDYIEDFFKRSESGAYKPNPTGYKQLDKALNGGLISQSLCVIGGNTSIGKTTFTLNLIANILKERPIIYYTLENSKEQIISKVYSMLLAKHNKSYSSTTLLKGYDKELINDNSLKDIKDDLAIHQELKNLYVIYPNNRDYETLKKNLYAISKQLKEQGYKSPLVVLDYLQFVRGIKNEQEDIVIKRVNDILKEFVINEDSIAFCIVANNRQSNQTKGESILSSGRSSSDIEYSCDYNFQLNFSEYEHAQENGLKENDLLSVKELKRQNPKEISLTIHKQRFNETGQTIDFTFNGITNTFTEIEEYQGEDNFIYL